MKEASELKYNKEKGSAPNKLLLRKYGPINKPLGKFNIDEGMEMEDNCFVYWIDENMKFIMAYYNAWLEQICISNEVTYTHAHTIIISTVM